VVKNQKTKPKKALESNDGYISTYVEDQTGGKRMELKLGPNATAGKLIKAILGALGLPDHSDYSLILVSQDEGWRTLKNDDLLYEVLRADSSSFLRIVPNVRAG
jgi:hypothetical protein